MRTVPSLTHVVRAIVVVLRARIAVWPKLVDADPSGAIIRGAGVAVRTCQNVAPSAAPFPFTARVRGDRAMPDRRRTRTWGTEVRIDLKAEGDCSGKAKKEG